MVGWEYDCWGVCEGCLLVVDPGARENSWSCFNTGLVLDV